ncbi:MAG: phosphotyrosine protein phosphatase [Rhizobiales bacterium PAR1]|nr:MAG: phosphotyrosine protein phosphatase [Rhizobiales bacterium PAR1]
MINALFVCSANKLRSPTAEQVFSTYNGVETDSAGLLETADTRLSPEQIEWSDIIFVMEKRHRSKLSKQFKRYLNGKWIICLEIPDEYEYMQPELVALLERKAGPFLRR